MLILECIKLLQGLKVQLLRLLLPATLSIGLLTQVNKSYMLELTCGKWFVWQYSD